MSLDETAAMRAAWPADFDAGARSGFLRKVEGKTEPSGHPKGFHWWPISRRNAWIAGYNEGELDRLNQITRRPAYFGADEWIEFRRTAAKAARSKS